MRMATPISKYFFLLLFGYCTKFLKVCFFFFFLSILGRTWGMFPCTNIDTWAPSAHWAFSCERLSMVMSLHMLSHICSDSWLQVLIVLINAPGPVTFSSPFSDRHGMFSWSSHESFLEPCSTHTNKKGDRFAGIPFLFFALLAFFCHSLLANTVTNCINVGMPDKKALQIPTACSKSHATLGLPGGPVG